jgi:hypothetical protein
MKALLSALLLSGLLAALAPEASAQRVLSSAYSHGSSYGSSHVRASRGYASSRVWVPGRYETIHERVWVPGRTERVWVEPVFRFAYDSCGNRVRVLVSNGHHEDVCQPGRYELRAVRVYRPGHWIARGSWAR